MAATIVQTSTSSSLFPNASGVGNNNVNVTFTNPITAGNHVIVYFGVATNGGGAFAYSVSDGTGYNSADNAQFEDSGLIAGAGIYYRANHPGGSITITVAPGNEFVAGKAGAVEVNGLQNVAPEIATKLQAEVATVSVSKTGGFTANDVFCLSALGVFTATTLTFTTPATLGGSSATNIFNLKVPSVNETYSVDRRNITNGTSGTITSDHGSLNGGGTFRSAMVMAGFLETTSTPAQWWQFQPRHNVLLRR